MNDLNSQLRSQAIACGLCRQWQSEWSADRTEDELIASFKKGQDFAIEHDFPSLEFIKSRFPSVILESNGVYVDADIDARLSNGTYVLLGSCTGRLHFTRWSAAVVWVRHDSSVTISADEFCRIQIRLYDNSDAYVSASDDARIRIFDRR
ncbi:MAG: hypothetical protein NC311_07590 [Muribaculaceae bacterium]|nr:hypothetical protein [Muribaculaceae bacterium]